MCQAATSGDRATAESIEARIADLHRELFHESNPIPVKWVAMELGLCGPTLRLPLTPLSEEHYPVVREAMALGLPPLIVDYAGPGELVQSEWGIKVPIGTRDEIIARFRAELTALCGDRSTLAPMGAAAIARVENHFTWERKADQVLRVYDWVLRGGEAPEFF